jgi:hypothetical protein
VYYITFFDEKVEVPIEVEEKCIKSENILLKTFFLKIICAFFAGGLLSDRRFLKIGII